MSAQWAREGGGVLRPKFQPFAPVLRPCTQASSRAACQTADEDSHRPTPTLSCATS